MEILNAIAQSEMAMKIIFYGGTALRLAYGSPRFSEDLDFLMIKKVKNQEFKNVLLNLIKEHKGISLKDFKDKYNGPINLDSYFCKMRYKWYDRNL